jgi:glucose dehydrogenase
MRSWRAVGAIAAAFAVGVVATGAGEARARTPRGDAPRLEVPPEVSEHADDWPVPGRDYANTRATDDSPITRKNVHRLEPAWSVPFPGASAYGNLASTPLVVGDTVYVQDLLSNVAAIDLETGVLRWMHPYDRYQFGPNGPAVGYGKVFVAAGSQDIAALDAETGDEIWSTRITATDTDGVSIQPVVVDGLVLAATVPISLSALFKGGDRGVLWALDAETGEKVWSFDTVKSPDLWGHPEINSGGGAWYPPAVDLRRGLVYWGTANPAPFPGSAEFPNGSSRPGPNLYTNSLVALDVRTGALAWYRQATPHDLFDRDFVLAAIARIEAEDGRARDVVVGSGKAGIVLTMSPDTGRRRTSTEVGTHRNDDLTELSGPTEVFPGLFGGVETPLATADGVVYTAAVNAPSVHIPDTIDFFGGAQLGVHPGDVTAVDAATGEVLWNTKVDGDPLGATTVVNDLVLTATYQGVLYALDRENGKIVWEEELEGGVNGWPAVAGDTLLVPVGIARPAQLVAYRLP